jgi:integrase
VERISSRSQMERFTPTRLERSIKPSRCAFSVRRSGLSRVDEQANELISAFLIERLSPGKSAWTIKTERSALHRFFQSRDLAAHVALPKRRRVDIVRSRKPAVRDNNFQPANWQELISFLEATGLGREDVRDLCVQECRHDENGPLTVWVKRGKEGRSRRVPMLAGREADVLAVIKNRSSDEQVFARVSGNLDIHALRRQYTQALYVQYAGQPIPESRPLRLADVDQEAMLKVSRALGHNRRSVVIDHYLQ